MSFAAIIGKQKKITIPSGYAKVWNLEEGDAIEVEIRVVRKKSD